MLMFTRIFLLPVLVLTALGQTHGRLDEYALVLEDEPVARRVQSRAALRGSEGSALAVRIRAAQSGLIGELRRRGVPVTGSTQTLVNAITFSATRETALELGKLPGVRYVIRAPKVRPNLDRAAEASNVQAAYAAVGGAGQAGAGVKIGIIDSGMDITHPGLQDASLTPPAGYPKGNTTYTNRKVIVARSYIAEHLAPGFTSDRANTDPAAISQPDDDTPRDFIGHGTALAMIAAGAPNTNAANGITIQGVAPKAFLGNYKIFGSPGLNDFSAFRAVEHALTDAIADGMDVVTLSLSEGDPAFFAPLDTQSECGGICDIYAQAVENTVRANVVVVVSAGNSGNIGRRPQTWSSVHSPGTAPSGITVGALQNSREMYQSVRRADGQTIRARFGTGPQLMAPLTAPVRDGGLGCSAFAAGSMAGAIALIQRGDCYIDEKVNFAHQAGAVAVIIYQASGNDIQSGLLPAATTGIPSALIGNADGVALRVAGGTVTLDPAFTGAEATGNVVWPASSRGPSPGDFGNVKTNVIKPEIAAVGANIYTAAQRLNPSGDAYNVSGYTSVTGTSYATAVVAGAAALVKQKNPGWSPGQIKSAVVNTANQDVQDGGSQASVRSVGAGRLNVGNAVNAAFTASPATISFGQLVPTTISDQRVVTLTGGSAQTVSVEPRGGGLVPIVSAVSFGSFTVRLQGTRPAAGSYEGFIVVQGGGQTLRIPYLYVVGDGVVADVFPVGNGFFAGGVGDRGWEIDLRAIDQYGVPVPTGTPVRFTVVSGGGVITAGDDRTFLLGNSAAIVNLSSTPGEHIFRGTVGGPAGPFIDFTGLARPYPSIQADGVVNAASNTRGVAAGSYVSIYGSALADAVQVERTPYLPVTLSSASVTFDADGVSLPGKLHFVSPGQVNAQVPWEFEGKGSVKVKVWMDYLPSNVVTVPLTQYAPAFFENSGLVAAQDFPSYNLITRQQPARRGGVVILYANGLGPVVDTPPSGEASGLSATRATPTVTVGGRPARVEFSGLTPGAIGLYQINVTLAADTPVGDQQIVVTIGGASSRASVIPVQ